MVSNEFSIPKILLMETSAAQMELQEDHSTDHAQLSVYSWIL
jgi:hypothetical protein